MFYYLVLSGNDFVHAVEERWKQMDVVKGYSQLWLGKDGKCGNGLFNIPSDAWNGWNVKID